jgi:signal transduction histidine kinase
MKPHLAIRTRFALITATLALGVLLAGMLTVYLVERREVAQALQDQARRAAVELARAKHKGDVSEHTHRQAKGSSSQSQPPSGGSSQPAPPPTSTPNDGGGDSGSTGGGTGGWGGGESGDGSGGVSSDAAFLVSGGESEAEHERSDDVVRSYLRARSGSDQLLLTVAGDGTVLSNRPAARGLLTRHLPRPGGSSSFTIGGVGYLAAVERAGTGEAVAAVPVAEAQAAIHRLLTAMLIVCALGLIPATLAAWWAARRALSPLSRIAQRASRVTAGDLSVRMGPARARDEIGEVSTAIDAMLDRLQEAFDSQQRFIDDASHELRTPLTIARGHLETALPPDATPQLRDAVAVAIAEIDRMAEMVDGLLGLARGGAGGASWSPVDVGQLIERSVERARVLGERTWRVSLAGGLVAIGDEGPLEQVLLNLFRNAVKHTRPGDLIDVSASRAGDVVRLDVCDHGEGIDPELLPRVFDRFVRADGARGRETGGTGLGLAICREIIARHGGTITAANVPSGGARFTIELPAAPVPLDEMKTFSPGSHV